MKTKLEYKRPCMQVVELREMPQLLAVSSNATLNVEYYEEDV